MKRFFTYLLVTLMVLLPVVFPSQAQAQTRAWNSPGSICVGTGNASDVATIHGLQCLIANLLASAVTIVGLAGFVMLIIGSFRYMLSGNNAKGVENARSTIKFAIVGLVVVLSAYFVLNIIASFTGVSLIKTFSIPTSDTNLP